MGMSEDNEIFQYSANDINEVIGNLLRDEPLIGGINRALFFDGKRTPQFIKSLADDVVNDAWVPVRIYSLSDDRFEFEIIIQELNRFLDIYGGEIIVELLPQKGSWFQKFWMLLKNSNDQVLTGRLEKIEKAIELELIDSKSAHIDEKEANAVSLLLGSMESTDNAVIQVGSILLVKVTKDDRSTVLVKTLTLEQVKHIDSRPSILKVPETLISELEKISIDKISEI